MKFYHGKATVLSAYLDYQCSVLCSMLAFKGMISGLEISAEKWGWISFLFREDKTYRVMGEAIKPAKRPSRRE